MASWLADGEMTLDEQIKDAEGLVKDIQGNTTGKYTTVYPFDQEDLRRARRYLRILKKQQRKREFDSAAEFVASTCEGLLG